jgi:hypothetical protein
MELTHAQAFNIIVNVSGQAALSRKDHETVTAALQKLKELIGEEGAEGTDGTLENGEG